MDLRFTARGGDHRLSPRKKRSEVLRLQRCYEKTRSFGFQRYKPTRCRRMRPTRHDHPLSASTHRSIGSALQATSEFPEHCGTTCRWTSHDTTQHGHVCNAATPTLPHTSGPETLLAASFQPFPRKLCIQPRQVLASLASVSRSVQTMPVFGV